MTLGRTDMGSRVPKRAALFFAVLPFVLPTSAPRRSDGGTAFVMKNAGTVVLARNLDGPIGDGFLFVNQRGVVKEAFGIADGEPLRWTSKYGSVTFNQFGREFPLGGMNEEGLVIEELNGPASYPGADARPALNELQWIQYQLDNHRSVKDVLKSEARLRISRLLFDLHFLVADRSGRSAVVEFAGGRMISYSGNDLPVRVLSNDSYEESIRHLRLHRGFGGEKTVPRGPESGERFVRAATLLEDYEWPLQGVLSDHAFTVLKSVERADTQWSIAYNVTRRLAFFKTRTHRRLKIVSLGALDFSCGSPVRMLPLDTDAGWVMTASFVPYDPQKNRLVLETVFGKLEGPGGWTGLLAPGIVRRMAAYPETCRCR
jgi:penicillin V acylase-like amidase (Ntn superfamily)